MKRVIIADDSATARMFVRKCLEIAGCRDAEFIEAGNGSEALEVIEGWGSDLLVTDLNMPGVDGVELVKKIRADKRYQNLPIIVITSANNPAKEKELVGLGATAVLAKPISPATMVQILGKIEKK